MGSSRYIIFAFALLYLVLLGHCQGAEKTAAEGKNSESQKADEEALHSSMLVVILLGIFISIARVALARMSIAKILPESSVVVLIGVLCGFVVYEAQSNALNFNVDVFFLILVPPIIWEAGYAMDKGEFFDNLGLILAYAILGTLLNAIGVGLSLYACRSLFVSYMQCITWQQCLTFGALISAVDPVGVLAIFEDAKVNESLHMLVFGESVLNDAVSIVLYDVFRRLEPPVTHFACVPFTLVEGEGAAGGFSAETFGEAIGAFLEVALVGLAVGIAYGLLCSFICRLASGYLDYLNPLMMFLFAYLSYMTSELLHVSGIVAIMFCGVVQEHFGEPNLTNNAKVMLHMWMKILATTAESIIFLYLGVMTSTLIVPSMHYPNHIISSSEQPFFRWDHPFVFLTLAFVLIYRFIVTLSITFIANRVREDKVPLSDSLVLCYGGIRGAIAFALSLKLLDESEHSYQDEAIITATLVVIWFTMYVQGTTIKPLLILLNTQGASKGAVDDMSAGIFGSALIPTADVIRIIAGKSPSLGNMLQLDKLDRWLSVILIKDYSSQDAAMSDAAKALRKQFSHHAHKKGDDADEVFPTSCPSCQVRFWAGQGSRAGKIIQAASV